LTHSFFNNNYEHLLSVADKIISKNGTGEDPYDLLNYSFLQLLEHEKCFDILESGFASFWIIRVMTNSIFSKTSAYRREVGLIGNPLVDVEYIDDNETSQELLYEEIDSVLKVIEGKGIEGWYIVNMFKIYADNKNYNKISRETGIPRKSITNAVKTCRDLVLQELKKRKYDEL
jgi:hypothetical protein